MVSMRNLSCVTHFNSSLRILLLTWNHTRSGPESTKLIHLVIWILSEEDSPCFWLCEPIFLILPSFWSFLIFLLKAILMNPHDRGSMRSSNFHFQIRSLLTLQLPEHCWTWFIYRTSPPHSGCRWTIELRRYTGWNGFLPHQRHFRATSARISGLKWVAPITCILCTHNRPKGRKWK